MATPTRPTPRQLLGELGDVLPHHLVEAFVGSFERAMETGDRSEMETARRQLDEYSDACASSAENLLRTLDPAAAFNQRRIRKALKLLGPRHGLEDTGLNRFAWILGVAGGGTDRSVKTLSEYFQSVTGWHAGRMCSNLLPQPNPREVPLGVLLNQVSEDIRRVAPTTIQFRWVSHAILTAAADEIAADPRKYGPLAYVTRQVIDEAFDYLLRAALELSVPSRYVWTRRRWSRSSVRVANLSVGCRRLLESLVLAPGSLAGQPFKRLAFDRLIETHPLVAYAEAAVPLGYREALIGLEQAFFEMTRRLLNDEKDRADLFERITSRCLKELGPADLLELKPPVHVRVSKKDPGEVDFAMRGPRHVILGECKAYLVTSGSDAVINSFPRQMGKAVKQLNDRAAAFAAGSPLTAAGTSVSKASVHAALKLAVPLHPYAGAVWNSDCLAEIPDGTSADIAIIPIHQLVILARALGSTAELSDYFAHRHLLRSRGVQCQDESDYLVGFLNPARTHMVRAILRLASQKKVHQYVAPCFVPTDAAIHLPAPSSSSEWRRQFYDMAECPNVA